MLSSYTLQDVRKMSIPNSTELEASRKIPWFGSKAASNSKTKPCGYGGQRCPEIWSFHEMSSSGQSPPSAVGASREGPPNCSWPKGLAPIRCMVWLDDSLLPFNTFVAFHLAAGWSDS